MSEQVCPDYLRHNVEAVRERIKHAAQKVNRNPAEIRLVAITKTVDTDVAGCLGQLGVREMGENRVPELQRKARLITAPVTWHMVGHLQTNKVRAGLPVFEYLHSLDSRHLAEALETEAGRLNKEVNAFIEVNLSGETAKYGLKPEAVADFYNEVHNFPHLKIVGLMTMAPLVKDPEETRPVFRGLRELRDKIRLQLTGAEQESFRELSMGMSQDFAVAVEEGATFLRIGTALFENTGA